MNIPVLSFLILKGKCAFCGQKISLRYPIIELLTGFMTVIWILKFDLSVTLFIYIVMGYFLIAQQVMQ